ncbi:MAG: hypothetical protein MUF26_05950 [Syntrophales bacterium]|jgi:hypothetical protein|nr:hypothetical protein [Syntrophales bacterium]
MSRSEKATITFLNTIQSGEHFHSCGQIRSLLKIKTAPNGRPDISALPFSLDDVTAGSETELQAAVAGFKNHVDLPISITQSNYFANIMRRAASGDTHRRIISDLEKHLASNQDNIWENSWVRFPHRNLGPFALKVFERDLLADKQDPAQGLRTDSHRFLFQHDGEDFIRVPVSYLLKLSLADAIGSMKGLPDPVFRTANRLLDHFLNDNTSPETYSFRVVSLHPATGMGRAIAGETAKRFLFTQLLVQYANKKYGLVENGQKALIYFSPHPPIRQKRLNDCISDAFYRELFMSPCLSGWNRGEIKHEYMHLCHRVLSRSQMNAVLKLREAGIINSNLILLPNTSNISLANNGTHVSLGSRRLSAALADPHSGFTRVHEKYFGDLVVKIVEYFLPLFVGTYSAAPYRLDFSDFHPERALGFMPHELDYTHLRMLWRRWRIKAKLKVFGIPVTPFGPPWLDRMISAAFGLKGDFVPDFRLIDYLVAIMSTATSPALDGRLQNSDRLKKDLSDLGVFDRQMSLYLLEKLREYDNMGFSGFEGRHYSLFESFAEDMGRAVGLQNLLYLLAFKYIVAGTITHAHIPDDPFIESERRQIFFGAAIGIPTFFVRQASPSLMMNRVLKNVAHVRSSRRYPGYLRVHNLQYRRALLKVIWEDGRDLVEMLHLGETLDDLAARLDDPDRYAVIGKLTKSIVKQAGARTPMNLSADTFNQAAERYYRTELHDRHTREALMFFQQDARRLDSPARPHTQLIRQALHATLQDRAVSDYVSDAEQAILNDTISQEMIEKMIGLMTISLATEQQEDAVRHGGHHPVHLYETPIH